MPYCETASNPDFQTSVTSQALVACNLQDKKAETALPPTMKNRLFSLGGRCIAINKVDGLKDRQ